jgi:hypothetical protein
VEDLRNVVVVITVEKRTDIAPSLQQVLTNHGCEIRTRIGMHAEGCSERGIIVLHVYSDPAGVRSLTSDLEALGGVRVNQVTVD